MFSGSSHLARLPSEYTNDNHLPLLLDPPIIAYGLPDALGPGLSAFS